MDTKDILCFRQVCEDGSLAKAASKIYLSPQALSKIIKKIEDELGVELFSRTPFGMKLTMRGEEFFKKSSYLVDELYGIVNN